MNSSRLDLLLPAELKDQASRRAAELGLSLSALVRLLLSREVQEHGGQEK